MKLLIVDDNRYVAEGLRLQIDWAAYGIDELIGAYNVAEAKKILAAQEIDFIFLDIAMPGRTGFASGTISTI